MQFFTGYIEGYYGKLLAWHDRDRLLDGLEAVGMTSYFYAPKDDAFHRQFWRQTYDAAWRRAFKRFTGKAVTKDIQIVAGISPGLDFDFASLDQANSAGGDFTILLDKALMLLADGANVIALLMDDVAADFDLRAGSFTSEGTAHAVLTNRLGAALNAPIILVPRIYADSLIKSDDPQSKTYLKDLARDLEPHHKVVYCGDDIVAVQPGNDRDGCLHPSKVIIWDNFYANDYCPTRLFLGDITGRDFFRGNPYGHVINGTGLINTDEFLISKVFDKKKKINLPSELLPLFDSPFKNINKSEINKIIKNFKDIKKAVFETTDDNLFLEWKPYLVQALNDIELIKNFKSKQTIETYLHRRYSPLVSQTFN